MQAPRVVKIEGLKVFFSDGDVLKKDVNNIWIYQSYLRHEKEPWEFRYWVIDDMGKFILEFPSI